MTFANINSLMVWSGSGPYSLRMGGGGLMVINCDGDRSSPFGNKVTSEEFRPDF